MMNRIVSLLLVMALFLVPVALTGCGRDTDEDSAPVTSEPRSLEDIEGEKPAEDAEEKATEEKAEDHEGHDHPE